MTIYSRLSQIYDLGWGDFSEYYLHLANQLFQEYNITQAKILDLACGTGTLAIELAHSGHIVKGIDSSPEMIHLAKFKSSGLSNISFEVADMTQFQAGDKYHIIMCTFDSINYVTKVSKLRQMLNRVALSLYNEGLFMFDSNTRWLYRDHHNDSLERELGGQTFIQRCTYNPGKNEAIIEFVFADGTIEVHRQRPYDMKELEPLLLANSFTIIQLFSWFDRRPYSARTEKLFCIAQKPSVANKVTARK